MSHGMPSGAGAPGNAGSPRYRLSYDSMLWWKGSDAERLTFLMLCPPRPIPAGEKGVICTRLRRKWQGGWFADKLTLLSGGGLPSAHARLQDPDHRSDRSNCDTHCPGAC